MFYVQGGYINNICHVLQLYGTVYIIYINQQEISSRMSLEQCVELWEVDSIAVKHNLVNLIEVR